MRKAAIAGAVVSSLNLMSGWVRADRVSDFAVFGNTGVTYNGFSTTIGTIGSNADINLLGASTTISGLKGYGNFNGSGDFQNVTGASIFNGNFAGGPLSNYGSVDAGGTASLQGNVTGNVTIAGDLTTSAFNKMGGNELVGGQASIGSSNTVAGTLGVNRNVSIGIFSKINNLIYGGTLTDDSTSTIGNQSQGTVVVQPQAVSLVPIPQPTVFVGGGLDQTLPLFSSVALSPGHYGTLTFNGSNTLTLTAGNYYFNSIKSPGEFTTLNLNVSGGAINIFVAGNVDFESISETINGHSFRSADPTLASDVYLEAHGSVNIDAVSPANGSNFFGTIYDPTGSIVTGVNESFIGSLLSGQSVTIGGANVTYEPSLYLPPTPIPEPGSIIGVICVGGLTLARRRRQLCLE